MEEPNFVDVNNQSIKKELDYDDTDVKMEPSDKNEDIRNMTDCEVNEFPIERIKEEDNDVINTTQEERNYKDVTIKEEELHFSEYNVVKAFPNHSDVSASNKHCEIESRIEDYPKVKMEVEDEAKTEEDALTHFHSKEESIFSKSLPNEGRKNFQMLRIEEDEVKSSVECIESDDDAASKSDKNYQHLKGKSFKCNYCEFTSLYKSNLKDHLRIHTGESSFQCSDCNFTASQESHLKTHVRTHTRDKSLKCRYCDYITSDESCFRFHVAIHTGEKIFDCIYCDYKTSSKSNLQDHVRTHTGEKPYQCSYCDYKASTNSNFKRHVRIHTGDKPFKCDDCGFKASDKSSLRNHVTAHTGEKPFKCGDCDYKTSLKSSLKAHFRIHFKEKPFKCNDCEYVTSFKSGLISHIKMHTGKKNFKCSYCDYTCSHKSNLKSHVRIHERSILMQKVFLMYFNIHCLENSKEDFVIGNKFAIMNFV